MVRVIRDKLPKGWAYPLKASTLERAIADSEIITPVTLFLHHGSFWKTRPLFTANFYLIGALANNEEEKFWVGCHSIVAGHSLAARAYIEAEAIPAFATWAAELEAMPTNSTRRKTSELVRDWVA